MKIKAFRDLLAKKYGIDYSVDNLRKIEKLGLFKAERTLKEYRVYQDSIEYVRPIILYFFNIPSAVIIRDNRDELKPYLARIRKALREVSQ